MPEGQVLEFSGVTKRFGAVTAVDGLTARVEPGRVTGFLGPNGAGKTTTLRILLGLVKATSGTATIGGSTYAHLRHPLQTVGAVLEASSFHPGRTGAAHLKVYAQAAGLPTSRVQEALGMVGLADVGGRKVGGYSLGMRQRLGLAYALLGDPGVLVLDEPANGLDPEGIKWMRGLLRELARQGRTVLVSSHLLAEVQQTVDSLLIISRGKLVFQGPLGHLTDADEYATVVDSPDRAALAEALRGGGVDFEVLRSGLTVRGVDTALVGKLAAASGIALSSLQRRGPALEEVFLDLVNGTRVHPSATGEVEPETIAEEAAVEEAVVEEPAAEEPVVESAGDEEPVVEEEPAVAEAALAGAAVAAAAATDQEGTGAGDAPAAEGAPAPTAGFVVAATGVVDIVPGADDETAGAAAEGDDETTDADAGDPGEGTEHELEEESAAIEDEEFAAPAESLADVGQEPATDDTGDNAPVEEPAPEQDPPAEAASAEAASEEPASEEPSHEEPSSEEPAYEEPPSEEPPSEEPADADSSDADPSDADPSDRGDGDSEDDRPWEDRAKTESDIEADAFFSMFDDGEGPSDGSQSEEPQSEEPQSEEPQSEAEPAASDSPEPPAEYNEPDETPDGQEGGSNDESDSGEPEREADAHEEGEQR